MREKRGREQKREEEFEKSGGGKCGESTGCHVSIFFGSSEHSLRFHAGSIGPQCDTEPLSSLRGPADKSLTPIPRYLLTFLFPSFFPSSPSLWGTLPKKWSLLSRGYQFSESLRRHFGKKCGFHQWEIFLFSPSEERDERIQVWNSPRIQERECERFVFRAPSLSGRRLKCTF